MNSSTQTEAGSCQPGDAAGMARLERLCRGQARLVMAVQDLSQARSLAEVQVIVRSAARDVTGADGATFVLREGDQCHYADEDAISPLWKGKRFPLSACISGWAMLNRQAVAIADIYDDVRIPVDAYRPTFVQSLVMVPIRLRAPMGAIGNYWAHRHEATADEVALLQALANTTAVAMENVRMCEELEQRVRDRTRALEAANEELEAFSYSVSHDLRAPLRHIDGFSQLLEQRHAAQLDEAGRRYLGTIGQSARKLGVLIDELLAFSRMSRGELQQLPIDLGAQVADVRRSLEPEQQGRNIEWLVGPLPVVQADAAMLRQVWVNLLGNAVKYTRRQPRALIEVSHRLDAAEGHVFTVRDNGAGFDQKYADRLFGVFQRLHAESEFEGTGIGLANVRRIVARHGGRTWAVGAVGAGATVNFSLPVTEATATAAGAP